MYMHKCQNQLYSMYINHLYVVYVVKVPLGSYEIFANFLFSNMQVISFLVHCLNKFDNILTNQSTIAPLCTFQLLSVKTERDANKCRQLNQVTHSCAMPSQVLQLIF